MASVYKYSTGEKTNAEASACVRAVCVGADARAAMRELVKALQAENGRRHIRGENPIAFEVQAREGA